MGPPAPSIIDLKFGAPDYFDINIRVDNMVAKPKTRLELAKLLRDRNFDPQVAGDEIMRVYQLSSDKRNSVLSLFSKISDNLKKSKKSVDHVTGDWWNVEIP